MRQKWGRESPGFGIYCSLKDTGCPHGEGNGSEMGTYAALPSINSPALVMSSSWEIATRYRERSLGVPMCSLLQV